MILRIFLIFFKSEPRDSYKKEKCFVFLCGVKIWDHIPQLDKHIVLCLLSFLIGLPHRYDGTMFIQSMDMAIAHRRRSGKRPRKIRYYFYCRWAVALRRNNVGGENHQYSYPEKVLKYLRCCCPGNVVGEIREDAFLVDVAQFCVSLDLAPLL